MTTSFPPELAHGSRMAAISSIVAFPLPSENQAMFSPFAMFGIGPMEMIIVGGIALMLFGTRLPGAMRSLGQGVSAFKEGVSGIDREDEEPSEK